MSFSDPQSVTLSGTTHSLPRVLVGPTNSGFALPDGTVTLDVSQQKGKNTSSLLRIRQTKISTDPLTDVKLQLSANAYVVLQRPAVGFTQAELVALIVALTTKLTANTNAIASQLAAGEA